jgi:hypothetical protein
MKEENTNKISYQSTLSFRASYFEAIENDNRFLCLSGQNKYTFRKKYLLYDLWPLIRILSKFQQNYHQREFEKSISSDNEICYIHRWNKYKKQFLIISIPKGMSKIELNKELKENEEFIEADFLKLEGLII